MATVSAKGKVCFYPFLGAGHRHDRTAVPRRDILKAVPSGHHSVVGEVATRQIVALLILSSILRRHPTRKGTQAVEEFGLEN